MGSSRGLFLGERDGGIDIVVGLVGVGIADVKAIVMYVVAGIRREGLRGVVGPKALQGGNV